MAIIQVKSEGMSADAVAEEKKNIAEFIEAKRGAGIRRRNLDVLYPTTNCTKGLVISSVLLQEYSGVSSDSPVGILQTPFLLVMCLS